MTSSQFSMSQFPLTQMLSAEAQAVKDAERARRQAIFQSITLDAATQRYMVAGQDPADSMLAHLRDAHNTFLHVTSRNSFDGFDYSRGDIGAVGFRNMGRNTVLVLACKESVIVAHVASDFGSDCLVHAQRESVSQDTREMVETIQTLLEFEQLGGNFTNASEYHAWMIGTINGGGRIDQAMNTILDDGLYKLGFLPHYHQYVQPTDADDTNPGLGSVVVFMPEVAGTTDPVIFVDDKIILKPEGK